MIVDNQPELDLSQPGAMEQLEQALKPAPKPETPPDGKHMAPESSSEPKAEGQPESENDVDHLKSQIRGLKAELTRRQGSHERVEALEEQLQALQTELKASSKPAHSEYDWISKLDDDAFASKQTDWDDELAAARAKYDHALDAGDERAIERQGQRLLQAKKVVAEFKKESLARVTRRQDQADAVNREAATIQTEIADMFDAVSENFPDLQDQSTDLWKAGNQEFMDHPALMQRLGPMGEIVAAAMAIVRNPALVKASKTAPARSEVIGNLERGVKRAIAGSAAPTTQRTMDIDVSSGEGLERFESMIQRIKGG